LYLTARQCRIISLHANGVELSEWRKIHDVNQAFPENESLSHCSVKFSIQSFTVNYSAAYHNFDPKTLQTDIVCPLQTFLHPPTIVSPLKSDPQFSMTSGQLLAEKARFIGPGLRLRH
jgi:hypothetical protein